LSARAAIGFDRLSKRVADFLRVHVARANEDSTRVDIGAQLVLAAMYRELALRGGPFPAFRDVAFRSYSQNQEDGILLYLFAVVGTTNRVAVEICAGDGIECNTANLVINHGWSALLVDGDERRVRTGREYYARRRETRVWPPAFVHHWVTAENVNDLLIDQGFGGDVDLLSLDLDGVDWWIWRAVDAIDPRVVVVEYQDIWGFEPAVTVPYDPDFRASFRGRDPDYAGASLAAFVKLGKEKGYRLVGSEPLGFNAFFLRDDVGAEPFPEIDPATCFHHPKVAFGRRVRLPRVAHLPWQDV
jgi:hypothetical protein